MKTPTRLFELLQHRLDNFEVPVCLADKRNGVWLEKSPQEVIATCNKLTYGLIRMGIEPGDRVAIISENRSEWNLVDFAIQQAGAIGVPMYPTISSDDYAYIFEHSGTKLVFASTDEICQKAKEAISTLDREIHLYSFDQVEGFPLWEEIFCDETIDLKTEMHSRMDSIDEHDLLTIIYTSGTTGRPKGVMLSHKNVISNVIAVSKKTAYVEGDLVLSFLPLCHVFERVAIYFYMYLGLAIYYAESLETIGDNLRELKPHGFNAVPRLLEKIYDKIIDKGYALTGAKKMLFFWAVNLGMKYEPNKNQGALFDWKIGLARKLIFSKWQEALGGNVKHIIAGASALQVRLKKIFWAADIRIMEGYGLTETSPGVCVGSHENHLAKLDFVGPMLNDVEAKIAEDGEILVKGPNVMQGYYKDPNTTAEVIQNGWFHTGDIGEIDSDGYLRITDRKKEMFKTSGGKYIAPQVIENKLKESVMIEQVMVIGENEKFPAALVVPNLDAMSNWCERHNVEEGDDIFKNITLLKKFENEINDANQNFGNWEQVKKFELIGEQWGVDTGELTPTMKLKRRVIKKKYSSLIQKIYNS